MKIIYLDIAGFAIRIRFGKAFTYFYREKWMEDIQNHFGVFILRTCPTKVDYTITFTEQKVFPIRKKSDKGKKYINYVEDVGEREVLTFYVISIAQLELILMEIISKLFKKNPGFFLHSSASMIGNGAWIFTGTNGAGKSTIVKLLKPAYEMLSDDASIVRKINGSYFLYQSIHHEKTNEIQRYAKGYPLKKMFFLKKAGKCSVVQITDKREIAKRLASQILIYFIEDKLSIKHLFRFITEFDSFYELSFPKKKEILSFLSVSV